MDVFPIDWRALDTDDGTFEIQAFVKTRDGSSKVVHIAFTPYFFVEMPRAWSTARIQQFIGHAEHHYDAVHGLSQPVKRKSIHGFTNNEQRVFVQLAFRSLHALRKARNAVTYRDKLTTYESKLDPLLRFFHVRDIQPCHWCRIDAASEDTHVRVDFRQVGPSECTDRPPITIASFDIECISDSGKFPNADLPNDKIITIATAFQKYGETEPCHRSVITLGTCDAIDGVDVIPCDRESTVLTTWINTLHEHGADVLVGYNIFGFDWRFVYGRALQCVDDYGMSLVDVSRLAKHGVAGGGEPMEKNLSSAAYGDNKFFLLSTPGIMQLDLLQVFRRELKLDQYSLGFVATKFLDGHSKLDLLPGEIFEKFKGTSADRAEIAMYCVRDVELPLKLMHRLSTLENQLEMANATTVPAEYLLTRGQQIKVFSLLSKKARSLGFVIPDLEAPPPSDKKYEGATVLEARKGGYFGVISALDFASLYPSIMRAHNLCPSTLVLDDARYGSVEGVEYYSVVVDGKTHKFAQNVPSVVPALLEELAAFRTHAKRDMAEAKTRGDTFKVALYNGKQLAYKVSMNSVYGFFGAERGMYPCVPIASSVTATGRRMIEASKRLAETLVPGTRVIYGDSVAWYTPIIVRDAILRDVRITTFEELTATREWTQRPDGKDVCEIQDMCIWSDAGWTALECVIRHRLAPGKRMVRVATGTGLVDVTDDHSLLHADGTPVRPSEIGTGSTLLHADIPCSAYPGISRESRYAQWTSASLFPGLTPERHVRAASMYALGCSLWDAVTITYQSRSGDVLLDISPDDAGRETVQCVHDIDYPDDAYVYDATTANHHFAAGIGRVVVHNTDSILCHFKLSGDDQDDMKEHFRVAQWVADEITKTFKQPIELEFEKCYRPYLLYTKKRYAGLLYTKPDAPEYVDVKGLQLVRRDSPPIVKDVSNNILNAIMHDRSVEKAIEHARTAILRVLRGEEPLQKFIMSKQLRAGYANENAQPHVVVAKKILQRRGYPVVQGERVQFVYVEDKMNADGIASARAEDPAYVTEHALPVDYLYYTKNQLLKPIMALLEVVVDDVEECILGFPDIQQTLETLETTRKKDIKVSKRIKMNVANKQPEITRFFKCAFRDD